MKATAMTLLMIALLAGAAGVLLFADHAHAAEPGAEPEHTNALADETSPYLLQHAHNPVDWMPWGAAAFEKAKREDKPIFLSVGYSTCHWCHVMAHEAFEDEQVAALLNAHFVCVKVDREELPDVDEQYMLATQVFTGRGGWPNSVWLTPDGRPWYAGTYYPKPQFMKMLAEMAGAWKDQRDAIEQQAGRFVEAIKTAGESGLGERAPLDPAMVDHAARRFMAVYDEKRGGFGDRPKFPPHGALRVLFAHHKATRDLETLNAVAHTLDAMRLGGMYDHVGGGFHRYSTDAKWFLPHFEKMLYDNAQLIVNYTDGWLYTQDDAYVRTIAETFDWLGREMTDEAGGFYSALDADSEGEEGKCYLWRRSEIIDALGEEDGTLFADVYHVTAEGTYYEEANPGHKPGTSIPHLKKPIADLAAERNMDADALAQKLAALRAKLLAIRVKRVPPHLDDKVLVSWNGLMIEALAYAGRMIEDERYTEAAARAADFILEHMGEPDGRLHRSWRAGKAGGDGYLDDYAYLIRGLLELHAATEDAKWLTAAQQLAEVMLADFYDDANGGFFLTSGEHDALLMRSKGTTGGGNMPSPNGAAAEALTRLALVTGDEKWIRPAAATFAAFSGSMARQPHSSEELIAALPLLFEAAQKLGGEVLADAGGRDPDADAFAGGPPVTIHAFASRASVEPGGELKIAVRLTIAPRHHIYAPVADAEGVLPTTIDVKADGDALTPGDLDWPTPTVKRDPVLEKDIATYTGDVTVIVPIRVAPDVEPGERVVTLTVRSQACDDRVCLAPQEHALTIPITIGEGGPPRHPDVFGK